MQEESLWDIRGDKYQESGREKNVVTDVTDPQKNVAQYLNEKQKLQKSVKDLKGKAKVIYLFFIDPINRKSQQFKKIKEIYTSLIPDKNQIQPPIFRSFDEVKWYILQFQDANTKFILVCDTIKIDEGKKFNPNFKILQILIYVPQDNEEDLRVAYQVMSDENYSKIGKVIEQLSQILQKLEEQILYSMELNLQKDRKEGQYRLKYERIPNFMKLSKHDKTEAIRYRLNLYEATNLQKQKRKQRLQLFVEKARQSIEQGQNQQKEMKKLQIYKKIHYFNKQEIDVEVNMNEKWSILVLEFYVSGIFYYRLINRSLRLMRPLDQYRPFSFPFFQIYSAIKSTHKYRLEQNDLITTIKKSNDHKDEVKLNPHIFDKFQASQSVLFRGVKCFKGKDLQTLKKGKGEFIEMLGFMSTSKSLFKAKQFTDESIILVVHVHKRKILKIDLDHNHGFVDLEEENITVENYEDQKEVIFNALNIFKILKTENVSVNFPSGKSLPYTFVHLQYGAIFELEEKKEEYTEEEDEILANYEYCKTLQKKIEDEGDVYLFLNKFKQAENFYFKELVQKTRNIKSYLKLSNVQHKGGKLQEAKENNENALKLIQTELTEQIEKGQKEKSEVVFSIHTSHAQITLQKNDFISAQKSIEKAAQEIKNNKNEDFKQKTKDQYQIELMQKKARLYFKMGKLLKAEEYYEKCEKMIQDFESKVSGKSESILSKYFTSCFQNKQQRKIGKDFENAKIKEERFYQKKVEGLKNMIRRSFQEVKFLVGNKKKYESYVVKGYNELYKKYKDSKEPQKKAKLLLFQLTVKNCMSELLTNDSLAEVDHQLELIEYKDSYDQSLSQLKQLIAIKYERALNAQKNRNPVENELTKPQAYHKQSRNKAIQKCIQNLKRVQFFKRKNGQPPNTHEILEIYKKLFEISYFNQRYDEATKWIQHVCSINNNKMYAIKAKIIGAKIQFSKGQLNKALLGLSQIKKNLQNFYHQDNNLQKLYQERMEQSEEYIEVYLLEARIYLEIDKIRQCIANLTQLKKSIRKYPESLWDKRVIVEIYEISALIELKKNNIGSFQYTFENALELMRKSHGKFHYQNAALMCKFVVSLLKINNMKKANKYIMEAQEIFNKLFRRNPVTWPISFCKGLFNMKQKFNVKALLFLTTSLTEAKEVTDQHHIVCEKIKCQIDLIKMKDQNDETRKNCLYSLNLTSTIQNPLLISQELMSKRKDVLEKSKGTKKFYEELRYFKAIQSQKTKNQKILNDSRNFFGNEM